MTPQVIIGVNNSSLELFGYTREEMMGKSISILMPERIRERHESYVALRSPGMIGIVLFFFSSFTFLLFSLLFSLLPFSFSSSFFHIFSFSHFLFSLFPREELFNLFTKTSTNLM